MSGTVTDKDHGYAALMKWAEEQSKRGGQKYVDVGIQGEEAAAAHAGGDGRTVAEVAAFHEFGLGNNPERSWLRATIDENIDEIKDILHNMASEEMTRAAQQSARAGGGIGDWTSRLSVLGAFLVGKIQERIAQGIEPPLADATIKEKGSSVPLIDSGQMRSSVTYKVTGEGGGGR